MKFKIIFIVFLVIIICGQINLYAQISEFDYNFKDSEFLQFYKPNTKIIEMKIFNGNDSCIQRIYFSKEKKIEKFIYETGNSIMEYSLFKNNLYNYEHFKNGVSISKFSIDSSTRNLLIAKDKNIDTEIYSISYYFAHDTVLSKKVISGGAGNVSYAYDYIYDSLGRLASIIYTDNYHNFSDLSYKYFYLNNQIIIINYMNNRPYELIKKVYDDNKRLIEIDIFDPDSTEIIQTKYIFKSDRIIKTENFIIKNSRTKRTSFSNYYYNDNNEVYLIESYSKRKKIILRTNIRYSYFND